MRLTWWGKLREMLPDANIERVTILRCPSDYFGSHAPQSSVAGCDEKTCCECWNGEYKGPKA